MQVMAQWIAKETSGGEMRMLTTLRDGLMPVIVERRRVRAARWCGVRGVCVCVKHVIASVLHHSTLSPTVRAGNPGDMMQAEAVRGGGWGRATNASLYS